MSRSVGSVLAVVVLTVLAATQLPKVRLDARILEVLPDLPAATDYRRYIERFGGIDNIFVAIESEDPDGLEAAAEVAHDFAERVAQSESVRTARCGLTDEDEAFWFESILPRAMLLGPAADSHEWERHLEPDALSERIGGMRSRLAGPLGAFEAQLFAADPIGVAGDLSPAFAGSVRARYDPGLDAFVSQSRQRVLVVVTPAVRELDADEGRRVVDAMDAAFAEVRGDAGVAVTMQAIGGPVYAVHDAAIIQADVVRTTVGSSLLVFVVLLAYFGNARIPFVLTLALAVAVLWIAGGVAVTRGYLSVFGISFGAILIGLGVDYGIHTASVFRDGLAEGFAAPRAMKQAIRHTAPAILTSAGTTGAAFLVLVLSSIAPVREMGALIAAGIAAVLLVSVLLGAPLAVLLSRGVPVRPSWVRTQVGRWTDGIVAAAVARRGVVLTLTAALTLLAAFGWGKIRFNADLRTMRPVGGELDAIERTFVEEFGLDLDTLHVVVRGSDLGAALIRAGRVERELSRALDGAIVDSSADLVPSGQLAATRAAALAERIDPDLPDRVRDELDRNGFALGPFQESLSVLDAIVTGRAPRDVPVEDWPDWVARDVHLDADGAWVAIRVSPERRGGDWPPAEWLEVIERVAPDAGIVSVPLLGRELQQAVAGEFRRLMGWSLALIALVVLVSFRGRPLPAALALAPVAVGSAWLLGLCGWLGLEITPFSVVVAPVLLGIGIDDGLHALHAARRTGALSEAVRRVGRAMVATTLTTAAGFGSLMLSRAPALQQAGFLVAAGTLSCLVVSLTLLPALDRRRPGAGIRSGDSDETEHDRP